MKKLLHIIATPREKESRTLRVSSVFMKAFKEKYPDCAVEELHLYREQLPPLTVKRLDGKYMLLSGKELSPELKEAWREIVTHIERFLRADYYLISAPMWNFSIPYFLKHYIDIIIQPKYLFRYAEKGVEGLAKNKKMVVITSRGGDYSGAKERQYDLEEPYLSRVFGFVGIRDITFINAQPMDAAGADVQESKIREAQEIAKEVAGKL